MPFHAVADNSLLIDVVLRTLEIPPPEQSLHLPSRHLASRPISQPGPRASVIIAEGWNLPLPRRERDPNGVTKVVNDPLPLAARLAALAAFAASGGLAGLAASPGGPGGLAGGPSGLLSGLGGLCRPPSPSGALAHLWRSVQSSFLGRAQLNHTFSHTCARVTTIQSSPVTSSQVSSFL